ncbi:hypothetical protein VP01_3802g1 [Puccinia sorghi]|uniref:Uncharacterized protein n=1 Tax=Puccinia sorghi TaxID=27349 RepID=A0A0L6UTD0_9BASI|nr:hypothetical protein VP01_3802g1 [Puccinia sorghi]
MKLRFHTNNCPPPDPPFPAAGDVGEYFNGVEDWRWWCTQRTTCHSSLPREISEHKVESMTCSCLCGGGHARCIQGTTACPYYISMIHTGCLAKTCPAQCIHNPAISSTMNPRSRHSINTSSSIFVQSVWLGTSENNISSWLPGCVRSLPNPKAYSMILFEIEHQGCGHRLSFVQNVCFCSMGFIALRHPKASQNNKKNLKKKSFPQFLFHPSFRLIPFKNLKKELLNECPQGCCGIPFVLQCQNHMAEVLGGGVIMAKLGFVQYGQTTIMLGDSVSPLGIGQRMYQDWEALCLNQWNIVCIQLLAVRMKNRGRGKVGRESETLKIG